ncbi:MAG: hypothetical protein ACI9G1_004441 [Pirellulaceae bacterium]|jgi:hypothetical protein
MSNLPNNDKINPPGRLNVLSERSAKIPAACQILSKTTLFANGINSIDGGIFSGFYRGVANNLEHEPRINWRWQALAPTLKIALRHGCQINRRRLLWLNFWNTELYEKFYLARLNYAHQNAVKHWIVLAANQYRWCSAAWIERTASPSQKKTGSSFNTGRVNAIDDSDVLGVR